MRTSYDYDGFREDFAEATSRLGIECDPVPSNWAEALPYFEAGLREDAEALMSAIEAAMARRHKRTLRALNLKLALHVATLVTLCALTIAFVALLVRG
jgi:hypothetical protein